MYLQNLYDLVSKNLPELKSTTALTFGKTKITYGELDESCRALAAWLVSQDVQRGDRIGIYVSKSIEEVIVTFACAYIGAVFVNISSQRNAAQVAHVIENCNIGILVTDLRRWRHISEASGAQLKRVLLLRGEAGDPITVSYDQAIALGANASPVRPTALVDTELAALLYTSGSTGLPKGVMLSHDNILKSAIASARHLENSAEDRVLGLSPLSFDFGLNQVTSMFLVGGSVALQAVAMPAEIVNTVLEQGVTGLGLVPTSWVLLLRYLDEAPNQFPDLRYVTNTGGKLPPQALDALERHFGEKKIFLMYGQTEAFRSTFLPPNLFAAKKGAIGYPLPNAEIFVVDPVNGLCGRGESGELIHRGSFVCMGYWKDPDATAHKIKANQHLVDLIGHEKVVHTGDIVSVDADGCMWYVGRNDLMIKCSGFRMSPTEIEDIVCREPLIEEAVAFGVDHEEFGQVVHLAVGGNQLTDDHLPDIMKFCRSEMPSYMMPHKLAIWNGPFPVTAHGKIDRPKVVNALRESQLTVA
ncbi:MAG: AMP-binding protein [Pseudomonadota bacterium]